MPKIIILQGNDKDVAENVSASYNIDAYVSVDRAIEHYATLTMEQNRQLCLRLANQYMDEGFNVAVQDTFKTTKDVKLYVLMADVRGYQIEFVRLPNCDENAEQLSWAEALAS